MSQISPSSMTGDDARAAYRAQDNQALKEKSVAVKDAVADLAGEAKRYATHRAREARETTGQWLDTAKCKAADYQESIVGYIQRNPYKAVGVAAGVGFVLGLYLKRR